MLFVLVAAEVRVEVLIPQIQELSSEVTVEREEEGVTIVFVASYQLYLQVVQLSLVSVEPWERSMPVTLHRPLMVEMEDIPRSMIHLVEHPEVRAD